LIAHLEMEVIILIGISNYFFGGENNRNVKLVCLITKEATEEKRLKP